MTPESNVPSRREFLASTAAVAAAGSLFTAGVHASGNDILKVGLVGCGGRGTGAAVNALQADKRTELTAIADLFGDRLQDSLVQLRDPSTGIKDQVKVTPETSFTGFDGYQKLIDSGVDVVLLCTTPHFRPLHLKAAVAAKKHVFMEKPVAIDPTGVRSVIASCEEAKKQNLSVMTGFCYRHDLPKRETIKRIHDGAIGDVLAVHSSYNTQYLWHRGREKSWSEMEYQIRNWLYFTWLSGDHIVEQAIHSIDKAAWTMKDESPIAATGCGGRQVRTEEKWGNIYDHFAIVYEYRSGAKVFVNCRQIKGCVVDVSDDVIGSKGHAHLMSHTINGDPTWAYEGPKPDMYLQEHMDFFAGIREGKLINDGITGAHSTLMGIMGRTAAYTGQRITWDFLANKALENLSPSKYELGAVPAELTRIAVPGTTRPV